MGKSDESDQSSDIGSEENFILGDPISHILPVIRDDPSSFSIVPHYLTTVNLTNICRSFHLLQMNKNESDHSLDGKSIIKQRMLLMAFEILLNLTIRLGEEIVQKHVVDALVGLIEEKVNSGVIGSETCPLHITLHNVSQIAVAVRANVVKNEMKETLPTSTFRKAALSTTTTTFHVSQPASQHTHSMEASLEVNQNVQGKDFSCTTMKTVSSSTIEVVKTNHPMKSNGKHGVGNKHTLSRRQRQAKETEL